jgi:hypothetical protein
MAAVMALVFLFVLASVGLMVKVAAGGLTVSTFLGMTAFVAIAIGVFVGTFRLARTWENET